MPKRQTTLLPWITILDSPSSSSNDNSDSDEDEDDSQQQPQHALPVISPNSTGRAPPPPLPVELLSIISKLATNRRALSETCWLFHDICLPLLFESVNISGGGALNRLLSISQKTHLAFLVRDLRVSFPDYFAYPSSFPDAMNLISTSLVHLRHLTTFTLQDSPESVYLTYGLQLAILTHPTLRELSFDRWYSTQNNLRPSFRRDRPQSIVLPLVSYPQPLHQQAHDILPMDSFVDRLGSYLVHFNAIVRVLSLRVGPHGGSIDGHPLNILLSSTLPGLETLQLTFDGAGSFKDFLKMGEWFSLFLAVHSNVTQIKFASAENFDGDPGLEVHLRFPWDALSNVGGLDERVMIPELRDWFDATVFKELELGLRKQQDSPGAWDLVGLSMRRHGCYDEPYELEPVVIEGLAARYPTLETLEIKGNFDSSSEISDYLLPFSTFATLHTLSFPTNYFDSDLAPPTCFHHAQQLEDELFRARSRWEEEEQRQRAEFQDELNELEDRRSELFFVQGEMDPEGFEREMTELDERTFEEYKVDQGYQDGEIDGYEEEDIDPDDHLLTRLLTSGLLTSRPTPRDFINKIKPDWIAIASSLPSLRHIQWTLQESSSQELGQVEWEVVRSSDGGVDLREDGRPDEDLEIARCMCDFRWDEGEIEDGLRSLPPLFEQEANFKPKFTLDGFVGGASRS